MKSNKNQRKNNEHLKDMKSSYIFLSSDIQLVMFAIAIRAITLFQLELRAGRASGDVVQRIVSRLALIFLAPRDEKAMFSMVFAFV